MKLKKHNRYAYSPITERQDFTWPDRKRLAFYCALNVEHFSFGGLKIDTQARVVSSDGEPIPGLYAAGELVGGIFWFNYPGGSGLTNGAVFGRIAGKSAATR